MSRVRRHAALLVATFAALSATILPSTVGAGEGTKIVPALAVLAARQPDDVRYIVRFAAPNGSSQSGVAIGRAGVLQRRAASLARQRPAVSLLGRMATTGRVKAVRSLWISNALAVRSDAATMEQVARAAGVIAVIPDQEMKLFDAPAGPPASGAEWGVAKVRADQAWAIGIDGEGVTVGIIDTGVQWDHPALKAHYRGWTGSSVDHNYSWFDAVTGQPVPLDLDGHGTHVVGTIVGDDGAGKRIGVAPGAKFMVARGCGVGTCSASDLLQAMQWMLAPTDLNGENPDPTKAPPLVSNSWGGSCDNTLFREAVQAWRAAGIVPVFANGNYGPATGTVSAPACYPESIGVGATDADDVAADFSARGPSAIAGLKPLVSAPGVEIISSIPGDQYTIASGTSMATPHVSGVIALLLDAKPGLTVDEIAGILSSTAIDLGDPGADDTYGSGRVDALAAVLAVWSGPTTGTITGHITDRLGEPMDGVSVTVAGGASALSDATGAYELTAPIGSRDVAAGAAGFTPATRSGVLVGATPATVDFQLLPALDHVPSVSDVRLAALNGSEVATNRPAVKLTFETSDASIIDGYLATTASATPAASDGRWQATPPTTVTLDGMDGSRVAYLWVKDVLGRVTRGGVDSIVLDTSAPSVRFDRLAVSGLARNGARVLRGRASDRGSGLASVEIAVRLEVKGACRWWSAKYKVFRKGSCASPAWFTPRGITSWWYQLRMQPGRYAVYTRAVDRAGNTSARVRAGSRRFVISP